MQRGLPPPLSNGEGKANLLAQNCATGFDLFAVDLTIAAAQSEHVNSKPLTPSSLSNNICSFWSASVFFCSSP